MLGFLASLVHFPIIVTCIARVSILRCDYMLHYLSADCNAECSNKACRFTLPSKVVLLRPIVLKSGDDRSVEEMKCIEVK